MEVWADLRFRPRGHGERRRGQWPSGPLDGLEHRGRGRPVQRAALPVPGDLQAPALRLGLHLLQRGELAPRQKLSRIYGIGRSILALSLGSFDLAGSTSTP